MKTSEWLRGSGFAVAQRFESGIGRFDLCTAVPVQVVIDTISIVYICTDSVEDVAALLAVKAAQWVGSLC